MKQENTLAAARAGWSIAINHVAHTYKAGKNDLGAEGSCSVLGCLVVLMYRETEGIESSPTWYFCGHC